MKTGKTNFTKFKRVILIVLDGVGCGELPDAKNYGDAGSDTLGNIAKHYSKQKKTLKIPNLSQWGIGHLTDMPGIDLPSVKNCKASVGKCVELSKGKDTTTGHWEMAGILTEKPFITFPKGFAQKHIDRWIKDNKLPGILGNTVASGTEIIKEFGEEHMKTGKPIVYTSADSVWQVAAHEESFGLEKLYDICKNARKLCDELGIARVIARPFVGKNKKDFKRTSHRKDFSQPPPEKTMMEFLLDAGLPVTGVGKIKNIYDGHGIPENISTEDNTDGLRVLSELLNTQKEGLLFVNLIDFDMLYGHRRDVAGFAKALEEFDAFIPTLEKKTTESDLVILTGDHGNDPTYKGTDHTREYVPMIVYSKSLKAQDLKIRKSFADIGQTICHALLDKPKLLSIGTSIFGKNFVLERFNKLPCAQIFHSVIKSTDSW